jgi:ABC-type Fe3+-hydroxamate transport system substrate-binding protein
MKTKITLAALLLIPLLFTGCASIVDGGAKPVTINSTPEGAKVTISNQEGTEVCITNTPAKVILPRSAGYFRAQTYTLRIEEPGYYPYNANVVSVLD